MHGTTMSAVVVLCCFGLGFCGGIFFSFQVLCIWLYTLWFLSSVSTFVILFQSWGWLYVLVLPAPLMRKEGGGGDGLCFSSLVGQYFLCFP